MLFFPADYIIKDSANATNTKIEDQAFDIEVGIQRQIEQARWHPVFRHKQRLGQAKWHGK